MRALVLMLALVVATDPVTLDDLTRERLLRMAGPPQVPLDPTNRWSGDERAAELGRWLFHEPRLSLNGAVSCATCHRADHGFAEPRSLASGLEPGTRHTQSILDAAHQRWLTWDGRSDSLWSQALHPFQSEREMGLSPAEVIERIRGIEPLRSRYETVFGPLPQPSDQQGIQMAFARVGKAIGAFERRLVTGPSAFDRWLERLRKGDSSPIEGFGPDAIRGAALFVGRAGCVQCHGGPLLSDGEFHMIGVPSAGGAAPTDRGRLEGIERLQRDPFNASGRYSDDPEGPRARVTRATSPDPESWGRFRTPSLRSAAVTPPYMHQGQLGSLEEVVRFYDTLEGANDLDHHGERVLEPLGLSQSQRSDLAAFLRGVQGKLPDSAVVGDPWADRPEKIPESGPKSPVPGSPSTGPGS